jgi:hypothetical protein
MKSQVTVSEKNSEAPKAVIKSKSVNIYQTDRNFIREL